MRTKIIIGVLTLLLIGAGVFIYFQQSNESDEPVNVTAEEIVDSSNTTLVSRYSDALEADDVTDEKRQSLLVAKAESLTALEKHEEAIQVLQEAESIIFSPQISVAIYNNYLALNITDKASEAIQTSINTLEAIEARTEQDEDWLEYLKLILNVSSVDNESGDSDEDVAL